MEKRKNLPQKIQWDDISLLIIGAGKMGASLTQAYAQNGVNVGLVSRSEESLKRAFVFISRELEEAVEKK